MWQALTRFICVSGCGALLVVGASIVAELKWGGTSSSEIYGIANTVNEIARRCESRSTIAVPASYKRIALAYISVEAIARPAWRRTLELEVARFSWVLNVPSP